MTSGVKNLLQMFEVVMRNVGTLLDSFGRSEVSTFSYGRQVRVACLTCRSDVRNARARDEEVTRDKREERMVVTRPGGGRRRIVRTAVCKVQEEFTTWGEGGDGGVGFEASVSGLKCKRAEDCASPWPWRDFGLERSEQAVVLPTSSVLRTKLPMLGLLRP